MTEKNLGIIGGGQLGSQCVAADKLNIKTTIFCDDANAPAQIFVMSLYMGNIMIIKRSRIRSKS